VTHPPLPPSEYILSIEESRRIFEEQIRPSLTGVARERPTVVFVAGQPGAGKTSLQSAFLARLGNDEAVALDSDDLLAYHPRYLLFSLLADRAAATLCEHDATRWREMAVDHVRHERLDVVYCNPFGRAGWAGDRMLDFRDAGYRVEIAFVAVHEAQSLLGMVDRYESQRATNGFGRWVDPKAHDFIYSGVLRTADRADAERLADAVYVVRRGGHITYSNQLVDGEWAHPPRTRSAIETERSRAWTDPERDHFRHRWNLTASRAADDLWPLLRDIAARAPAAPSARLAEGSLREQLGLLSHSVSDLAAIIAQSGPATTARPLDSQPDEVIDRGPEHGYGDPNDERELE